MGYSGILVVHIGGGVVGILSGFAALFLRKGSQLHRVAGLIFFVSMIVMAASASYLGYVHPDGDIGDIISGFLTIYMASTAWMTVKRRSGETGAFEIGAFIVAAAGAVFILLHTQYTIRNGTAFLGGYPGFMFGGIMALAAVLDLSVILRGGMSGAQRMARHLWRMCFALFIAAGSFFLGQMQVFPESIRRIEIISVPVVMVIALMIYWLIRVLFVKRKFGGREIDHAI